MLMSSADHSVFRTPVTELASQRTPSFNHHIYLRLRLALSLNLRRQIFIAVCDDVGLRHQFTTHLHADLSSPGFNFAIADEMSVRSRGTTPNPSTPTIAANGQTSAGGVAGQVISVPRLVTLPLDLENPDILGQIELWQAQNSVPDGNWISSFQITGVETLTRQPAHLQRVFLNSLQAIAENLDRLNFNVVLWVTRPWCRSIQQSAPNFWQWHTALFEFEGDPAPVNQPEPSSVQETVPQRRHSLARESRIDADFRELVLTALKHEVDLRPELSSTHGQPIVDVLDDPSLHPVRLLHQIEKLHRDQAAPDTIGTAYRELGDWYRDRAQQLPTSQADSTVAIRAYEQSLRFITSKSPQVPDVLNDIGNLYWMMARTSNEPSVNLEKALKAYQFALERMDAEAHPETYAMLLNNLGSVYSDLSYQQAPVENLNQAIAAYQSCLHYRLAQGDLSRYAATQNNLGTTFWNLAQHQQPALNLQHAIAAYNEALRHYDPEREPLHYAMLQNNLGTAYWALSQCNDAMETLGTVPEDFLLLAIGAYRVALVYRTFEVAPTAFAATQNNLGTAYWHLANQPSTHDDDRQNYVQCAIAAYKESLTAVQHLSDAHPSSAPTFSFDVAATHHNLGSACYQTATNERVALEPAERSACLETALYHHVQALHGWQHNPDFYQTALIATIQTVKAFSDRYGIQGQTLALSRVPANLLPIIMKEL
ncbi:tetratricopeptide repeat protein [Myxacorys almedinensis]|uniref:Tetratricopeptide repeat protein n=1 Tax=Myxacorys almedinensis A TaxID=2690445 RepID=A0A8J8CIX2_9CYAN|nr:tetratricopeptide repeat protein [Myxacorys almedinensis]NDJ18049.1 tetratricopeptide repeat protein [Myxacorys almedinensis A]